MTVQIREKYEDWPLELDNGGRFLVFSHFIGQGRAGQGRAGHRAQHQGTYHTTCLLAGPRVLGAKKAWGFQETNTGATFSWLLGRPVRLSLEFKEAGLWSRALG